MGRSSTTKRASRARTEARGGEGDQGQKRGEQKRARTSREATKQKGEPRVATKRKTSKKDAPEVPEKPLSRAERSKEAQGKVEKRRRGAEKRAKSELGPRRKDLLAGGDGGQREQEQEPAAVRGSRAGIAARIPLKSVRRGEPMSDE